MNKIELIDATAAEAGLSKVDAKRAIEASFSSVKKALTNGGEVSIVGFGAWPVAEREARDARNPRIREIIKVSAKKVVKSRAGTELADAVNK